MVNFGPLAAEICWRVCGTTANFNGFRVLAALVQRRRSPEASQTLHDVWPSPGLLHYIYIFGGSCPLMEFCHVQSSRYVQVLRFPILAALLHGTLWASAKLCGVEQRAPPIFGRAAITLSIGPHSSFFLLFFSSTNLSRRRLDVYVYLHTWCGLSANLECRSETCCTRLAGNAGPKKSPKIAVWVPSHNFVGLYLRN